MTTLTEKTLRDFLFGTVAAWNGRDKTRFMGLYREIAPEGVTLEYVGKTTLQGDAAWAGLEAMWSQYVEQVQIQAVEVIVNGSDLACYYRNLWRTEQTFSTGIETYSFRNGTLLVRMFH